MLGGIGGAALGPGFSVGLGRQGDRKVQVKRLTGVKEGHFFSIIGRLQKLVD